MVYTSGDARVEVDRRFSMAFFHRAMKVGGNSGTALGHLVLPLRPLLDIASNVW